MTQNQTSRRERRKAAQASNAAKAAEEEQLLTKETVKAAKAAAPAVSAPKLKLSRREQTKAAQQAAVAQAERDARLVPMPAMDGYKPGERVPLHVLNQRAKIARQNANAAAEEIGREIGRTTRDLIKGKTPRGPHTRFAKQYADEARRVGARHERDLTQQG